MFKVKSFRHSDYLILLVLFLNIVADFTAVTIGQNTAIIYNILIPIEIAVILLIYWLELKLPTIRKVQFGILLLFICFAVWDLITTEDIRIDLVFVTFLLGGVLVALGSYFIWREAITNSDIRRSNILLWFATANIIYYIFTMPGISAIAYYWEIKRLGSDTAVIFTWINRVLYLFWVITIGIGFLCKRKPSI